MQISSAIPTEHIITVSRHLLITLLNLLGSHDPVVAVEYLSVRYKTCASLKLQYIYILYLTDKYSIYIYCIYLCINGTFKHTVCNALSWHHTEDVSAV